jgi:hypothetical protein
LTENSKDHAEAERTQLIQERHRILDSWVFYESRLSHLYSVIAHGDTNTEFNPFALELFKSVQSPETKLKIVDGAVAVYSFSEMGCDEIAKSWQFICKKANKFRSVRNVLSHSSVGVLNQGGKSFVRISQWDYSGKLSGYSLKDLKALVPVHAGCILQTAQLSNLIQSNNSGEISKHERSDVFAAFYRHLQKDWSEFFTYPPQQ